MTDNIPAPKRQFKRAIRITRAKLLDLRGFNRVITHVRAGEHALRNEVLVKLSFFAGLRAQEIAGLQWKRHLLDSSGKVVDILRITHDIAKGSRARIVERNIPLTTELRTLLGQLRAERPKDVFVIYALSPARNFTNGFENRATNGGVAANSLVKFFKRLYEAAGVEGCTSHSGRRTFITKLARNANKVGASIRDVQDLAGHRSLETTAGYIEPSKAQRSLVGQVFA